MNTVINQDYVKNLIEKDVIGKYIIQNGKEYGPITNATVYWDWDDNELYITFYYKISYEYENKIMFDEESTTCFLHSNVILTDKAKV